MPEGRKFPPELRERAIRLEPGLSIHAAVQRIGPMVGANPDTLRTWYRPSETDAPPPGAPGLSPAEWWAFGGPPLGEPSA
jgi:transposase-like protein